MSTRFLFFIAEELCRISAVHVEKHPETVSICDSKSREEEKKEWSLRCFVGNDRGPGAIATVEEGLSLLDSSPVGAICQRPMNNASVQPLGARSLG